MIFLMFNMGNSGGSWFESVCNSHPKVRAWEELLRILGNTPPAEQDELLRDVKIDDITISFLREQKNSGLYDSIGLIKSFRDGTIKYCKENNGRIVQMFRNPIKVLNTKMYTKKLECIKRGVFKDVDTKEKEFEAHIEFYQSIYLSFLKRSHIYRTIRLEDLSRSLEKDPFYFREVVQYVTGVLWSIDQVENVRINVLPRQRSDYKDDHEEEKIWETWSEQEREIFVKYFKDLMVEFSYRRLW